MTQSLLDQLFPPGAETRIPRTRERPPCSFNERPEDARRPFATNEISGRWQSICSLELRGFDKKEIAEKMGMAHQSVIMATNNERYKRYRAERLAELDDEFHAMKPLAFAALRGGLKSADENTALRASEQWFKAASFGGFSKTEQTPSTTTAEDVARALMLGVQVNVNVTAPGGAEGAGVSANNTVSIDNAAAEGGGEPAPHISAASFSSDESVE